MTRPDALSQLNNTDGTDQYRLARIVTIWALAAVPMPILAFVIAPAVFDTADWSYVRGVWLLLIGGMIWQFILSMLILHREGALVSWAAFRERVGLNAPRDPKNGQKSLKLFWWLLPKMRGVF